jgi:hypothetical protein
MNRELEYCEITKNSASLGSKYFQRMTVTFINSITDLAIISNLTTGLNIY